MQRSCYRSHCRRVQHGKWRCCRGWHVVRRAAVQQWHPAAALAPRPSQMLALGATAPVTLRMARCAETPSAAACGTCGTTAIDEIGVRDDTSGAPPLAPSPLSKPHHLHTITGTKHLAPTSYCGYDLALASWHSMVSDSLRPTDRRGCILLRLMLRIQPLYHGS